MAVQNIYALILAAGQSSRMGRFKALLRYNKSETFLSRLVKLYLTVTGNEPVVVVNERLFKTIQFPKINTICRFKTIINNFPDLGRFYSVQIGLKCAPSATAVFIQDVDRPLVKENTLNKMAENYFVSGYTVPWYKGKSGHPVLLGRKVISDILSLTPECRRLDEFLATYKIRKVDVDDPGVTVNINTKEDYFNRFEQAKNQE